MDRQVWANNVDPDQTFLNEQSDQSLHFLLFSLYRLDALLFGKTTVQIVGQLHFFQASKLLGFLWYVANWRTLVMWYNNEVVVHNNQTLNSNLNKNPQQKSLADNGHYFRIKIWFFNVHGMMKLMGRVRIPWSALLLVQFKGRPLLRMQHLLEGAFSQITKLWDTLIQILSSLLAHLSRRLTRWAYSIPMVRRPSVVHTFKLEYL